MSIFLFIGIAIGTFIGNWLICPLIIKGRTFTDGFFIGLIAAIIVLIVMVIFKTVTYFLN